MNVLANGVFYLIKMLISYYLTLLIHEVGHAIFVKMFKGEVKGIGIGMMGKTIFSFGKFYIKKDFLFGSVYWEMPPSVKKYQMILVYLAGPLFNLITVIVLWKFVNPDYNYYYEGLLILSQNFAIINLIPFRLANSFTSDGRQILDIVRNKKS